MSPARERGWGAEVIGGETSPGDELGGLVVRCANSDRMSISTDLRRLLNLGQVWRTCNSATTFVVSTRELSARQLDELQAMGNLSWGRDEWLCRGCGGAGDLQLGQSREFLRRVSAA